MYASTINTKWWLVWVEKNTFLLQPYIGSFVCWWLAVYICIDFKMDLHWISVSCGINSFELNRNLQISVRTAQIVWSSLYIQISNPSERWWVEKKTEKREREDKKKLNLCTRLSNKNGRQCALIHNEKIRRETSGQRVFVSNTSTFIKMQVYCYVIVNRFPKANQSINKVPMYNAAFSTSFFFLRSLYPRSLSYTYRNP